MKFASLLITSFAIIIPSITNAAMYCNQSNCELFIDDSGSLIDSKHDITFKNFGNFGGMVDVSIIRYDNQHVLIRDGLASDEVITAIPLAWNGKNWSFNTIYIIESSLNTGKPIIWDGIKLTGKFINVDAKTAFNADDVCHNFHGYCKNMKLDNMPDNEKIFSNSPSAGLYIWTGKHKKPEYCYIPLYEGNRVDISPIACRKVISLNGTMNFTGAIGKDIPIVMVLTRKNDAITGKYMYPRNRKEWINLRGKISSSNKITLDELDGKTGAVSAIFSGAIKDGYIAGSWTTVDKKKTFPFRMLQQGFSSN